MSRPQAPAPRRQFIIPEKPEVNEPLKCGSTPQSPSKSPKGNSFRPAPPPVLPKKHTVKRNSGGSENGGLEIVKVQVTPDNENETLDEKSLMKWWKSKRSWDSLSKNAKSRGKTETTIIKDKAEQLYKAIQVYIALMSEHGSTLEEHTMEMLCIADNLDKVSKGTKIAGITGGATTAVGGVAAAAGVILSPFTLGASLALTAVGVGVAAAGGITGASAAIANKVSGSLDEKKIKTIFQEHTKLMDIIEDCLKYINAGMEELKQHDLSVLSEARKVSVRVAKMIELSATGGASAKAIEATSKASGLINGFALGMDYYFTQGKDGQKVKKGLESKFAKKIRKLAEEANKGSDELMQIKDLFSKNC